MCPLQLFQSTSAQGIMTRRSVMEKSIGFMFLQVIGAAVVCGLSVAGTGSASSIMNNSLNPYTPLTSVSTSSSMLETYLQTFPINEQQNILTTAYHHSAKHSTSTMGAEKEKPTTLSASSYSPTTVSATEPPQYSPANSNTLSPFVIGSSTYSSVMSASGNLSENPEQPVLIPTGPILLGCGPNNREGIGIQKALDWLREKRVSDFGWENDTHMVILAKEVSLFRSFLVCN
jgi:gastric intrinsic factor